MLGDLSSIFRRKIGDPLQGYNNQQPFLVVSNAVPRGYLPLPALPSGLWYSNLNADRKN